MKKILFLLLLIANIGFAQVYIDVNSNNLRQDFDSVREYLILKDGTPKLIKTFNQDNKVIIYADSKIIIIKNAKYEIIISNIKIIEKVKKGDYTNHYFTGVSVKGNYMQGILSYNSFTIMMEDNMMVLFNDKQKGI